MLYQPGGGVAGVWLLGMWAMTLGAVGGAIQYGGPHIFAALSMLAWTGYTSSICLRWGCVWVRVDAATLEWRSPLRRGQVPLHDVLEVARESRWNASIDIRGHHYLVLPVQDDFEFLTAAIVAGAPHVRVVDNRD